LTLSHGNNEFGYTVREKITECTYFSLLMKAHSRWDSVEMRLLQNGRVMVQNVQGRQNRVQGNNARGIVAAGNRGLSTELDMAQNEDNIFRADQCNAFDSDVDEAPTAQTMFMANLSSIDPVYDSDTISEVQDHDNCLDNMNESHEEHEMHHVIQPNDIVDSNTEYTSNNNIILYEQYIHDNEDKVVHSDVSYVPNDVVMIITNDIYEQDAPCVTSYMPNDTVNTYNTSCFRSLYDVM
ncbi:hypothetical protein Tco_1445594, partial [Tanacetum coccineum]